MATRLVALAALATAVAFAACGGERHEPKEPAPRAATAANEARGPLAPPADARALPLVPRPRQVETCPGTFAIGDETPILTPAGPTAANALAAWLGLPPNRPRLHRPQDPVPAGAIVFVLEPSREPPRDPSRTFPASTSEEAYSLDVSPDRVTVRARSHAGLFYGAQALAELAGARPIGAASPPRSHPAQVPCVRIADEPRSRFRAMHLDVARHFFSKEIVERYIDLLAFHRFNVFHWHLTDDQGFRIPVARHPELTEIGGVSGAYTAEDIREVVAYAKARFVTVIPEVDLPGHTRAILASHPELSCKGEELPLPTTWGVFDDVLCVGNDATFTLVSDVLASVTDLFPSHVVHIGGDEVPTTRWKACPKCRARMEKENLLPEELEGWFLARVASKLAERGRRVAVWDEATGDRLPKDAIVVAWHDKDHAIAAAKAGHDVVMAPHDTVYFNYHQSRAKTDAKEPGHEGYVPWTKVLAFDPSSGLDPETAGHLLGGEGALWTEYVTTREQIDTLTMPRMAALAEALWSAPRAGESPEEHEAVFASRLQRERTMLDASKVRYFVAPPVGLEDKKVFIDGTELTLAPPPLFPDGAVRYELGGRALSASSPMFKGPVPITTTTDAAARLVLPGGRTSAVVRGRFEHTAPLPAMTEKVALHERVKYTYYEGDIHTLADIAKLSPSRKGLVPRVGLEMATRAERFAVVFAGIVNAHETGVYRFAARADDGVAIDVDGIRVVTDDGAHPARDASGEVALAEGLHAIRVTYFQRAGEKQLAVTCGGPKQKPSACRIFAPPP